MITTWEMSFVTSAGEDHIKSTPDLHTAHDKITDTSSKKSRSDYSALSARRTKSPRSALAKLCVISFAAKQRSTLSARARAGNGCAGEAADGSGVDCHSSWTKLPCEVIDKKPLV